MNRFRFMTAPDVELPPYQLDQYSWIRSASHHGSWGGFFVVYSGIGTRYFDSIFRATNTTVSRRRASRFYRRELGHPFVQRAWSRCHKPHSIPPWMKMPNVPWPGISVAGTAISAPDSSAAVSAAATLSTSR